MLNYKSQKGFTLIELLVVVAIISLLSSVVLGALNDARAKARDRALIQQVKQIQSALELYRGKYGEYPDITPSIIGDANTSSRYWSNIDASGVWGGSTGGVAVPLNIKLSEFINVITPPSQGNLNYYNYRVTGTLSKCSDHSSDPSFAAPYTIVFKPETDAFKNFPDSYYNGSIHSTHVGYKCASIY